MKLLTSSRRRLLSAAILAMLLLLAGNSTSQAQQTPAGITVSPGVVHVKVSSNKPVQQTAITVRNNYQVPVTLSAQLLGIDDSSGKLLPAKDPDPSLDGVFSLSETNFTIAPLTDYKLILQSQHTDKLAPGGHYASLLLTQGAEGQSNVSLRSAVSVAVFLTNSDGVHESLQLVSFSAPSRLFDPADSAKVSLKNDGNVHLVPRGVVTVERSDGTVLAQGILNTGSNVVLPGKTFDTEVRLTSIARSWLPQRVQTKLQYRVSENSEPVQVVSTSWLVPPQFLVGLLVLIIVPVLCVKCLLVPVRKARVRKRNARQQLPDVIINSELTDAPDKPQDAIPSEPDTEDDGVIIPVRVKKSHKKIQIKD